VEAILDAKYSGFAQGRKRAADHNQGGVTSRCVGWNPISILPKQERAFAGCLETSHLTDVTEAAELVCKKQAGEPLREMATALITTFLQAKMRDAKTSVAPYSVSSDVDRAKIAQQMGTRFHEAIVGMLATAREALMTDPQLVASILQGMIVGVSRRMLESGAQVKQFDSLLRELIVVACAYLDACSACVSVPVQGAICMLARECS
jgi:hypothetical protein